MLCIYWRSGGQALAINVVPYIHVCLKRSSLSWRHILQRRAVVPALSPPKPIRCTPHFTSTSTFSFLHLSRGILDSSTTRGTCACVLVIEFGCKPAVTVPSHTHPTRSPLNQTSYLRFRILGKRAVTGLLNDQRPQRRRRTLHNLPATCIIHEAIRPMTIS
jgi:hypothetical protein